LLLYLGELTSGVEMRAASSAVLAATVKPRASAVAAAASNAGSSCTGRRNVLAGTGLGAALSLVLAAAPARAADDEYVSETKEVIGKVRSTINMDKSDPDAVAEVRVLSNSWVAKYRREKSLLGRPSFRETYSALNAVSGHYVSFGPTAPIPAKRRARILEEMDTAEKALLRGR
jgi:photosystem II Psb27 protein